MGQSVRRLGPRQNRNGSTAGAPVLACGRLTCSRARPCDQRRWNNTIATTLNRRWVHTCASVMLFFCASVRSVSSQYSVPRSSHLPSTRTRHLPLACGKQEGRTCSPCQLIGEREKGSSGLQPCILVAHAVFVGRACQPAAPRRPGQAAAAQQLSTTNDQVLDCKLTPQ